MKRVLAVFTTLALLVSMLAVMQVAPVSAMSSGDYTYSVLNDGTAQIDAYSGSMTDVEIPSELGGVKVSAIGAEAFFNNDIVETLTVPQTITAIGDWAFYNCDALDAVYYRGTEEDWAAITIGSDNGSLQDASLYCRFGSVQRADGYTYIAHTDNTATILGFSATDLVIPSTVNGRTVTRIKDYAFQDHTTLRSVVIPDTVTSIGNYAFSGCTSLTDVAIPDSVTYIGGGAFEGCTALTSVTIPYGVEDINYGAFAGCTSLTDVSIPDSVTYIGGGAFEGCTSLTSVTIPYGVDGINYGAFAGCTSLVSITIPYGVKYIYGDAFLGCTSLTNIEIPNNVAYIDDGAFSNCTSLANIDVGAYNEEYCDIDGVLFNKMQTTLVCYPAGKQGTEYSVPDGVAEISSYAFSGSVSLTNVLFPDSLTEIGDNAFYNAALYDNTDNWENGVLYIGTYLIAADAERVGADCAIKEGTTFIANCAFSEHFQLTSITIPGSVQTIGSNAFYCCENLKAVHITDLAAWCAIDFSWSTNPLYYGADLYVNNELVTTLTIPDGVTEIKRYAFYNADGIVNVILPEGVTYIEGYAFASCDALTSVSVPQSLKTIDWGAFALYDTSAITVYYGGTMAQWREVNVYTDNRRMTVCCIDGTIENDTHPTTTTTAATMMTTTQPTDPPIPTTIRHQGLVCVTVSTSGLAVSGYTLPLTAATSITLPDTLDGYTVKAIGDGAFDGFSALKSITIPETVTTIGSGAFASCKALKDVYYLGDDTQWGQLLIGDNNNYLTNARTYCRFASIWEEGDCRYVLHNDQTATLTDYTGSETKVIVPASVNGCAVKAVAERAFYNCDSIKQVILPEGVTAIGRYAFYSCGGLQTVTLPASLDTIENNAFYYCSSLNTVYFAGSEDEWGAISIGDNNGLLTAAVRYDFVVDSAVEGEYSYLIHTDGSATIVNYSGSDTEIVLPDALGGHTVTGLGEKLFESNTALKSVALPAGLTAIGNRAFYSCTNLESVKLPDTLLTVGEQAFYNCDVLREMSFADGLTTVGKQAFFGCEALRTIRLPDTVTSIGAEPIIFTAYSYDPDHRINGVLYIDNHAINAGTGTFVVLENNLKTVADGAFSEDCRSLQTVYFSGSEQEWNAIHIGENNERLVAAEKYFHVQDTTDDNGVTYLLHPDNTASVLRVDGTPTSLTIPQTVNGHTVTTLMPYAFRNQANLTEVSLPDTLSVIGENAFYYCSSLASLTIPASVTTIGSAAFLECTSLVDVVIPEGIKTIERHTFLGCTSLQSVTIPETVTSIGIGAFSECAALATVDLPENLVSIGEHVFASSGLTTITLPQTVTAVVYGMFEGCASLRDVTFPDTLQAIDAHAFSGCEGLETMIVPEGVTSIGKYAFSGCINLKKVVIPETVTSIVYGTFIDCERIGELTLPSSLESVGVDAFTNCYITDIHIGSIADWCVMEIANRDANPIGRADNVYADGALLTQLTVPAGVTAINEYTFSDYDKLTSVVVADTVGTIDNYAFAGCTELRSVTIPASVTYISPSAFAECSGLVIYGDSGSYAEQYAAEYGFVFVSSSQTTATDDITTTTSAAPATSATEQTTTQTTVLTTTEVSVTASSTDSTTQTTLTTAAPDISTTDSVTTATSVLSTTESTVSTTTTSTEHATQSTESETTLITTTTSTATETALTTTTSATEMTTTTSTATETTAATTSTATETTATTTTFVSSVGQSGSYIYITVSVDTVRITDYIAIDVNVEIPSSLDGYTVVSIGVDAFNVLNTLDSVVIPATVTQIDDGTFDRFDDVTVMAPADSYAASYAAQNGIAFEAIEEPAVVRGDVTGDSVVTIADAVQMYYHVNGKISLDADALARGDVANPAGSSTIADAVRIYYFVNGKIENL